MHQKFGTIAAEIEELARVLARSWIEGVNDQIVASDMPDRDRHVVNPDLYVAEHWREYLRMAEAVATAFEIRRR